MILKVGDYTFHESYVAFHFVRDNPYSPWETIGCCLTYGNFSDACYPKHKHLRQEFKEEAAEAGPVAGTYEFMELWHQSHQTTNDVVSKPIRYCTMFWDVKQVLEKLGTNYVLVSDTNKFAMLAVMLKSRKRYFPVVYQERNPKRPAIVAALREAGYVQ